MSVPAPRYAGVPRSELEARLIAAEAELDRLRAETTALNVGALFVRWQCPNCGQLNTFASECGGCGRDAPTEPVGAPAVIDERARLHRVLVRVASRHIASPLGRTFRMDNGTGDARCVANRERARLDFDHALISRRATWRHVLIKCAWEVAAHPDPTKLAEALTELAATATRWLEVLGEDEWADKTYAMTRRKPRSCRCIRDVQAVLDKEERNTRILTPIQLTTQAPIAKAIVATEQIERGRGKRKPTLLVATFCPFCGKEYP